MRLLRSIRLVLAGVGLVLPAGPALAIRPTAEELAAAKDWERTIFAGDDADLPFTFVYDGRKFPAPGWKREREKDAIVFTDPTGTIRVTCEVRLYRDFPATSWMLRFKNVSASRSKVVSDIKPLDVRIPVRSKDKFHLVHHAAGAMQSLDDYRQYTTVIAQEWWRRHSLTLTTEGGRACASCWPYFNVETPDAKAGMIAAIGWSGQWSASFDARGDDRAKIVAGQDDCRFWLEPGEEVRTPRVMALLYRRADWLEAQNLWRAWFLRHNAPRCNGQIVTSHVSAGLAGYSFDADGLSAKNMLSRVDEYFDRGVGFDYWWIDAAWYEWKSQWNDASRKPHWRWTGNWEPDPVRFPKGPGEVFAHARERGAKGGILWFEIERVVRSAKVAQDHPEYLYPEYHPEWYRGHALNLGREDAWRWAFDTVDGTLKREGANVFRLDFNFAPLSVWRNADTQGGEKNRCGVSEMKHVAGLLRLYDAILKADPSRRIDNCAQGGCRNDFETLSRAVPLWRTDTSSPVDEQQMQTLGISLWLPLYGGGTPNRIDAYELRSRMQPYFNIQAACAGEDDWRTLRSEVAIWRKYLAPHYVKDYYPLTRSDAGTDLWTAWEFVDAEKGEGFVQAFRREASPYETFAVWPKGLDPAKRYVFEDVDTHETRTIAGDASFTIAAPPRSAKIYAFRPAGDAPVRILNDAMRAFLSRPRWERIGLLQDPAFRAAAVKAGSLPKPFLLKVSSAATSVELVRAADRKGVRTFPVKDGVATVDNLMVATDYAWTAKAGGRAVGSGRFRTEDDVPRICRIDGIGNVRDLGGRTVADGRRIRQGLLYRTAAFNRASHTPKGKKAEWHAGQTLVGAAAVKEALETFRFRTDLDFRNDEETYGMTGSPLGTDVRWAHVVSSNYDDLRNPGPAAAFAKDFRLILDRANLPLVFHCVGGADRTGTFAWLLGGILGESEDDLWKDWELTVFNYEPLKFNHYNFMGSMTRWLEEKYPNLSVQERCVAYAKDFAGVTDAEIDAFRKLMLEEKGNAHD